MQTHTGRILLDAALDSAASALERQQVPPAERWNLDDLYPSRDAWRSGKQALGSRIDALSGFKGRLTEAAETLLAALRAYFEVSKELGRLTAYAQQLADEDIRIAEHQGLLQEMQALNTTFGESTAFLIPEFSAAAPERLRELIASAPALQEFRMFFDQIERQRAHILSAPEEKLLASVNDVTEAAHNVYTIFSNAELPYPEITLATGETIRLTAANYTKYRSSPVRADRQHIFQAFFTTYGTFKNTLGANLVANLKSHYFYAKNRHYASSLHAALNRDNLPVSVYENVITQIRRSLPTLHRFLDLKRRMLGVETLHYYDLYASLAKTVDLQYAIADGQRLVLDSLAPLGQAYCATVQQALTQRWIDYRPTPGKRSGAYSNGAAYDVHPYILLNWQGNYDSLSTLTHEIGHTLHSYLANTAQPFATAEYSIFVAEIASTLNESLLNDYVIRQTNAPAEKLFFLGHYLEGLRGTVFRQVLFAEFEWAIHKQIEAGEPLTGESLSALYFDLTRTYYGHDQGVCLVDDNIQFEWAFIPHFYYNYYVFQYATSLIYATAFSAKILPQADGAVDKYLGMLQRGGSAYPLELIRAAGLDPLSAEPFALTMQRMNAVIDEIETLIA